MVECLPSNWDTLSSNLVLKKKRKRKKNEVSELFL
jgi:hypothetical protein